jgi:hypothetical protein
MFRMLTAVFVFFVVAPASAAEPQYGTAEEAKAMPERAVAAVKEDKTRHLMCSIRAGAASRIETFMCGARTPRTAS